MSGIPFHPLADIFPLIEGAEFDAMVADMRAVGFRQGEEIVMHEDMILDGRNRYRAAVAAGLIGEDGAIPDGGDPKMSWIFVEFGLDGLDGVFTPEEVAAGPLAYVISRNLRRRHLNESQRAMAAAALANLGHGGARRPKEPGKEHGKVQAANLPLETALPAVSQADAARLMNVSERLVRDAKTVREQATPELKLVVETGRLAVSAAHQAAALPPETQRRIAEDAEAGKANVVRTAIKQGARAQREAALAATIEALPEERFGLIGEDPEWRFEVWSRATGLDRAADNHYPTSGDAQLATERAAQVMRLAADHCVHLMWTTDLARGIDAQRARGFTPKSYIVWVKTHREVTLADAARAAIAAALSLPTGDVPDRILVREKPPGTGYWTVDEDEILLIGTRGSPVCPAMGRQGGSVWYEPRRAHSVKPECFYRWVEAHFPSTPRIELNARRRRPGWQAWGSEVKQAERWRPEAEREALARGLIDANGMVRTPDGPAAFYQLDQSDWTEVLAQPPSPSPLRGWSPGEAGRGGGDGAIISAPSNAGAKVIAAASMPATALEEYKALGAVDAGLTIAGPILTDLRARGLIEDIDDQVDDAPVPVLTAAGEARLAILEAQVNAARIGGGDGVRIAPSPPPRSPAASDLPRKGEGKESDDLDIPAFLRRPRPAEQPAPGEVPANLET